MNIAIFTGKQSPIAINTIKYFKEHGLDISLIIIETEKSHKLPKTKQQYFKAHDEYYKVIGSNAGDSIWQFSSALYDIWLKVPGGLRMKLMPYVKSFVSSVFFSRRYSIEKMAKKLGVPVMQVKRHSSKETKELLEKYNISYAVLAQSEWLIKEPLLSMENMRIINAHSGKLPRHRSLDSMPWSVLEHDETGLCAHFVDAGVDTGPILDFIEVKPVPGDTLVSLATKINEKKPEMFFRVIQGLKSGTIIPVQQQVSEGIHHRPMTVKELLQAEEALQTIIKNNTQ